MDRPLLARILRKSSSSFRRYLLALRESLARPQEIRAATWAHLWWPEKPDGLRAALLAGQAVLVLDDFKARRRRADANIPRLIPVSPRLGRLLWRLFCRGAGDSGHIFLNHHGRPWTNNAVRCRMRWIRKTLRLARDHRGENIVCYSLRHTGATWAAAAGLRDRLLADVMGHSTTRTTARYQHLQIEDLQAALRIMRARIRQTKQGGFRPTLERPDAS